MAIYRLVLVGPPGVGKGTQAELLEKNFGATQLSTGMIFRKEMEAETELGQMAKGYMEKGELVPDEVTIGMVANKLKTDEIMNGGFILDGFPRNVSQAEALDEILTGIGERLDKVISIEVDQEVVVDRLSGRRGCPKCTEIYHIVSKPPKVEGICDKCGTPLITRSDDNAETIRARLKVFADSTAPVIGYYEDKGILARIDGTGSPDEVYAQIATALS